MAYFSVVGNIESMFPTTVDGETLIRIREDNNLYSIIISDDLIEEKDLDYNDEVVIHGAVSVVNNNVELIATFLELSKDVE